MMTKIAIKADNKIAFEVESEDWSAKEICKDFLDYLRGEAPKEGNKEPVKVLAELPPVVDGVREDVVAIYDDAGIPSIMHRFTRVTNAELFGGSNKPHPAFVIGGEVYDEIYISVYQNCNINGKPYSLPMQKPWTDITNDDAAAACFSKGEGWHLMTAAEWGLLANISLKNGTLPHGNTDSGKYHADRDEHGTLAQGSSCITLTGSGPATWTHNHKPTGVHDLCGNIWEMVRGLRIIDGTIQAAVNNDAAMDIDLTEAGDDWASLVDDENGKTVKVSVEDGKITFTTNENINEDYDGTRWENVKICCKSERLQELALFAGEPNAYCYIDSSEGECFPYRGGYWSHGTYAGVFYTHLALGRAITAAGVGFRSAYYKKH